ncbi:O-methyltransferase [Streptomyces olivaceoviridis]|uniref:O-methyltransferase n=1 Tax=Streptomyces olivaceoviridis TaxID=1921 RepID=UPI0036F988BC
MAGQTAFADELLDYVRSVSLRDDDILRELREATVGLPMGRAMQVMAEEGQLLALLVSLTGARSVVEVGTFTGYSTLCMARALPPEGRIVTCDVSEKWPMIAEPYWQRARVADRIEVRIGDARETLAAEIDRQGEQSADLIFIDADKVNYGSYYELGLRLLRPGGLMIVDNTVFFGRVIDPRFRDEPDTAAVRRLNAFILGDERVDVSLLTMADGITLVRKRG